MSLEKIFEKALQEGRRLVIPYLTAGFPDFPTFFSLLDIFQEKGIEIVEVGIPFSDPVADGPVIQESSHIALEKGVTLSRTLRALEENRGRFSLNFVIMGYYNPFLRMGLDRVVKMAKRAGVKGFIVPDLPVEEGEEWRRLLQGEGLDTIFLVAPTTSLERVKKISRYTSGFLYCVSVTGVTGPRERLPGELRDYLISLRRVTTLPRAVGFGISRPEQIRELRPYCEGMVVGSALIRIIQKNPSSPEKEMREFIDSLQKAACSQDNFP